VRPGPQASNTIAVDEFLRQETATAEPFENTQAKLVYSWLEDYPAKQSLSRTEGRPHDQSKHGLSYLTHYGCSEVPHWQKPPETVLASLKDIPIGTPIEEIRRAADAFGLDFTFMKVVAKIESGFNPNQRTGSHIGLFQLSNYEFAKYGSGSITNPRDNAIAAAYKFTTEGILFELDTHKQPTRYDRYLIHQQGTQGAAEHIAHPKWVAWKSICATEEGKEKGESWCKRAIWNNTLPASKERWKTVERLTSAGFVDMWRRRLDRLYARYSVDAAPLPAAALTLAAPSKAMPPISPSSSKTRERRQSKQVVHAVGIVRNHKQPAYSSSTAMRSSGETPRGHKVSRQLCPST
jgi:hypothetical protein